MSSIILGIGDIGASSTPGTQVKTYALGSCVAVILLSPQKRAVGMAHIALPDSSINQAQARERTGYFADTAIPALLHKMGKLGCRPKPREMIVKLAGGAAVMGHNDLFNIGKRNILTIKRILWKYGLGPLGEDTGGNISRTVSVKVDTGEVILSSPGRPDWKI